jgi:hypothetical protein
MAAVSATDRINLFLSKQWNNFQIEAIEAVARAAFPDDRGVWQVCLRSVGQTRQEVYLTTRAELDKIIIISFFVCYLNIPSSGAGKRSTFYCLY